MDGVFLGDVLVAAAGIAIGVCFLFIGECDDGDDVCGLVLREGEEGLPVLLLLPLLLLTLPLELPFGLSEEEAGLVLLCLIGDLVFGR